MACWLNSRPGGKLTKTTRPLPGGLLNRITASTTAISDYSAPVTFDASKFCRPCARARGVL
jgi:hypothetical protein